MQTRVWRHIDIIHLKWGGYALWIISTSNEVDSGYYPPQMERNDWSDSFVYVTIQIWANYFLIYIETSISTLINEVNNDLGYD